jgi:hypothetical protein
LTNDFLFCIFVIIVKVVKKELKMLFEEWIKEEIKEDNFIEELLK